MAADPAPTCWSRRSNAEKVRVAGAKPRLHDYIGHLISPLQTASLFYLMAFGMIVRWRTGMYRQYRRITPDVRP